MSEPHTVRALSIHSRLGPEDDRYIDRPNGSGKDLALRISRGLAPLVVTGPPGAGKSTELERALAFIPKTHLALHYRIEEVWPLEKITPHRLVYHLCRLAVEHWVHDTAIDRPPSTMLGKDLTASDPDFRKGDGRVLTPATLAEQVFAEMTTAYGVQRIVLLVDGLDDLDTEVCRGSLKLLVKAAQVVDIAVVVGPAVASGSDAYQAMQGYRIFPVPPIDTTSRTGKKFLRDIVLRRLERKQARGALKKVIDQAAALSGGLPKRMLTLLADAAAYEAGLPTPDALMLAAQDHQNTMRRMLGSGDLDVLATFAGTDGLDVPSDRKVRFLSQELLIEYQDGLTVVVRPNPLLESLLKGRG